MKINSFKILVLSLCVATGHILAAERLGESLDPKGVEFMRRTQQTLANYPAFNEKSVNNQREALLAEQFAKEFPEEFKIWHEECEDILFTPCKKGEHKELPSIPCKISDAGKAAVEKQLLERGFLYWREFHAYNAELHARTRVITEDILIIGATPGGSVWNAAMNFDCWKLQKPSDTEGAYPSANYPCVATGCLENPHIHFADMSDPAKTPEEVHPYLHQKHRNGRYFPVDFNDHNSIAAFQAAVRGKQFKQIIFDTNVFCWSDPAVFPEFFSVLTQALAPDGIMYIPTYASECSTRGQKKKQEPDNPLYDDLKYMNDLSFGNNLQPCTKGYEHRPFDHSVFDLIMSIHGPIDYMGRETFRTAHRLLSDG